VVTDGGSLAAHASLVAREYGIPAVVGAGDATRPLRTGQLVTVDGTTGMVTVHPPPERLNRILAGPLAWPSASLWHRARCSGAAARSSALVPWSRRLTERRVPTSWLPLVG
jgi:PEP-utilising enzyme, mobile domain